MPKDARTRIDLRIDPLDAQLLDEEAAEQNRSLNNHIATILRRHLDDLGKQRSIQRRRAAIHAVQEAANGGN